MRYLPPPPIRGATYFRLAACAPFALPIVGLIPSQVLALLGLPGAEAVATLFGALLVVAWIGGLPYLLGASLVLWKLRHASGAAHARAAWWLPLPYGVLMFAAFLGIALTEAGTGRASAVRIAAIWGACGLGFGYGYMLLAQIGYRMLNRKGMLSDTSTAE